MKKTFLLIWLPVALLIGIILGLIYYAHSVSESVFIETAERSHINIQLKSIVTDLDHVVSDLLLISEQHAFRELLESGSSVLPRDLAGDFLSFSRRKGFYDQIRYINEKGMEIIRINYNRGNPSIVPEGALQFKGKRYYFRDTFRLEKGEVYVSPFDLNIERGELEVPFKPMIRFGTPVFDKAGRKKGILILNYLGVVLINNLKDGAAVSFADTMLLNSDGYWLMGPMAEDEWGFMIKDRSNKKIGTLFPQAWQKILQSQRGQFVDRDGLFTFDTVYPLLEGEKSSTGSSEAYSPSTAQMGKKDYYWKIVSKVPPAQLYKSSRQLLFKLSLLYLLLLALAALGAWLLARATVRDREAEEAIERAKVEWDQSFDAINDFICVLDIDGGVLRANKAMRDRFEPILGDLNGRKCCHIYGDSLLPESEALCLTTLTKGAPVVTETELPHLEGWYRVGIFPCMEEKGMQWGAISVVTDITEIKRSHQAMAEYALMLEESNRMKDLFTDIISHDLINPAQVINNFAEILLEDEDAGNDREIIESIVNSSAELLEIIINASKFSRLEAIEEIDCREMDLNEVLKSEIRNFDRELEDKSLIFSCLTEGKRLACVNSMIRDVFMNLISNAIKYSRKAGRIEARIEEKEDCQLLSVRDSGIGIADEDKIIIFDRFQRAGMKGVKGSGLGLAIASRIVALHKGKIWVEDNPGGGSIFYVSLPKGRNVT